VFAKGILLNFGVLRNLPERNVRRRLSTEKDCILSLQSSQLHQLYQFLRCRHNSAMAVELVPHHHNFELLMTCDKQSFLSGFLMGN